MVTNSYESGFVPHNVLVWFAISLRGAFGSSAPRNTVQTKGRLFRVFLLSSFSHDDSTQWLLIPHFFEHYTGRLGIHPEHYLLILHSDAQNVTGLERMARWLRHRYGVVHTFPDTMPYTSRSHSRIKIQILNAHVTGHDWVMQVDADEFVFFPLSQSASMTSQQYTRPGYRALRPYARPAYRALREIDMMGANIVFGLMVDRVVADGSLDHRIAPDGSIFSQYPLNCALTLIMQGSDVRKVSAYRGYLRTTSGNHQVIALNISLFERGFFWRQRAHERLLETLREEFGDGLVSDLPRTKTGFLPIGLPTLGFATIYHFKWIKGVAEKLNRRLETEEYTGGQYRQIREKLGSDGKLSSKSIAQLCNNRDLPRPEEPPRALTALEQTLLFLKMGRENMEKVLSNFPEEWNETFTLHLLLSNSMNNGIGREWHMPLV